MKKIHSWSAQPGEAFYDSPEIGYKLSDDYYALFEKMYGAIHVLILNGYSISSDGYWNYNGDNILLEIEVSEDDKCWEDIQKFPENYLAEVIL